MAIDLKSWFSVTPSSDPAMTLVRTLLEYPGTNDNVVVRIRKTQQGFVVDDGGDVEWFVTAGGGSLQTTVVKKVLKYCRAAFDVEMQEDGKLVLRPIDEADVNRAVVQVAQTAISVFSAAMAESEK